MKYQIEDLTMSRIKNLNRLKICKSTKPKLWFGWPCLYFDLCLSTILDQLCGQSRLPMPMTGMLIFESTGKGRLDQYLFFGWLASYQWFSQHHASLKVKPKFYLAFCTIVWGILTIILHCAKDFKQCCAISFSVFLNPWYFLRYPLNSWFMVRAELLDQPFSHLPVLLDLCFQDLCKLVFTT